MRQGRHGRRGDGGPDGQSAQAAAEFFKTVNLALLCAMQTHHFEGQHVFFDHIGQIVGGVLPFARQSIQTLGQDLHDPGHAGRDQKHHQGQLPVQKQQIADQGQQRKTVARQADHGRDQLARAALHLIHDGVGQRAGRFFGENGQIGTHQTLKHGAAQPLHTVVGNSRQAVLRDKMRGAADRENTHDRHRHRPQGQGAFAETLV